VNHRDPIHPLFETPLVRIGHFRCPIDHPRFHDTGPTRSHLFVFPRTSVWIEQEGRRPFVSDPTHAVLYNPRHQYARRAISPEGDRSDFFGVSAALHREMLSTFEPAAADAPATAFSQGQVAADAATYRTQRCIVDYVRQASHPDAMAVEESVIEVLHQLLVSLYRARPREMTSPARHRDLVEDARAFLARHFAEKQSLSHVARALECSVFHLCRVFRKQTGLTLHEYRQQLRLRNALESVTSGRGDLLEVALGLGYSGHSHFTAAFRDAFGAPPSVLRAQPLTCAHQPSAVNSLSTRPASRRQRSVCLASSRSPARVMV
jgi:AraC-like DNA-binding protein